MIKPEAPSTEIRALDAKLALASRPGFREGLVSVWSGYRYLFRTPDLWLLALVPTLVTLVCALFFAVVAVEVAPLVVAALVTHPGSGFLWTALLVLLRVFVTLVGLALALALAFALGKPLSGPALERIVRHVERDLGAPAWPAPSLLQDVVRSLQSSLVALAFTLPIVAVLGLVSFVFAPAAVVTFPLQLAVTAIGAAWDLCDYPLSIRGVAVSERIHFVRRNFGAVLGFGLGLALLSFLPCTLLVVLPAGVIGATHLVVSLERWEAQERPLLGK